MANLTDMLQGTFRQLEEQARQLEQQTERLMNLVRLHHEYRKGHDHDLYEPYDRTPLFTLSEQALKTAPAPAQPYPPGTQLVARRNIPGWTFGPDTVWTVMHRPETPATERWLKTFNDGVGMQAKFDLVELAENFMEVQDGTESLPVSVQRILDKVQPPEVDPKLSDLLRDVVKAAEFVATCNNNKAASLATGAMKDAKEWEDEARLNLLQYLLDRPALYTQRP